jgi:predicted nucleic acid-binding protein
MSQSVIVDTGVLVAFLSEQDRRHIWVNQQLSLITPPLLTCEAVISETSFLLSRHHQSPSKILRLLQTGLLNVPFNLAHEAEALESLMNCYANVPMSFADACLVRMSELINDSQILTFDSDFTVYRRYRNQVIPVLMP